MEGVSTRKVKEVTEELCGTSFSKSLVSSLAGSLDSELEAWRDRRLEARGLERLNQEIKRRSRVVRIFPNERSCLRLVTALAVEQSEEWITGRRYLDMGELEGRCPEEERAVERVIAHETMR